MEGTSRRGPAVLTAGKLLSALALPLAATLVCSSIRPEPGEPLGLRWLRVLEDHPIRAYLAALFLIVAATPSPRRERDDAAGRAPRS